MKTRRSGKISKFGAIVLSGCAVLLALFFLKPRSAAVPFEQLPVAEQEKRRAEVHQLEDQAKDIAGKAKRKAKAQFKLTVTQDQLNTMLQERLQSGKAPIHDVQATLSPDTLTLDGNVDYKGMSVPATLSGAVSAQNGQVSFRADSLKISGLPAPGALKDKVESDVNQKLSQGLTEAPIKIDSVAVEAGQLTISGITD